MPELRCKLPPLHLLPIRPPAAAAAAACRRFGALLQWQVERGEVAGRTQLLRYAIVQFRRQQDAVAAYGALNHQVGGRVQEDPAASPSAGQSRTPADRSPTAPAAVQYVDELSKFPLKIHYRVK